MAGKATGILHLARVHMFNRGTWECQAAKLRNPAPKKGMASQKCWMGFKGEQSNAQRQPIPAIQALR